MTWHVMMTTPVGTTWASEEHPYVLIHQTGPRYSIECRHPRMEKHWSAPSWEEAERAADEMRVDTVLLRVIGDSWPVFDRPDSVTHCTCPSLPDHARATHHMVDGACRYCKKPQSVLESEQKALWAIGRRVGGE